MMFESILARLVLKKLIVRQKNDKIVPLGELSNKQFIISVFGEINEDICSGFYFDYFSGDFGIFLSGDRSSERRDHKTVALLTLYT